MTHAVLVEGIVKRFGDTVALNDVGITLEEGRILGFLGPNGAGKTTLVRVLAALLCPDEGRAEVFGHDVVTEAASVREIIGLMGHALRPPTEAVGLLDHPAGHVRRVVRVRVRGAIETALPPGIDYVDFLLPGIFVQYTAFRTTQTAVGLAEDLERGVIDRFRSMPMARSAVLMGRTLADLVRSLFVIFLMVGVGYLIGFRFQVGFWAALGSVAIVGVFGFALSWIFTGASSETARSAATCPARSTNP